MLRSHAEQQKSRPLLDGYKHTPLHTSGQLSGGGDTCWLALLVFLPLPGSPGTNDQLPTLLFDLGTVYQDVVLFCFSFSADFFLFTLADRRKRQRTLGRNCFFSHDFADPYGQEITGRGPLLFVAAAPLPVSFRAWHLNAKLHLVGYRRGMKKPTFSHTGAISHSSGRCR